MLVPLYATDVGFAVTLTVGIGGAATVIVTLPVAVPPVPVQEIEYVIVFVSAGVV